MRTWIGLYTLIAIVLISCGESGKGAKQVEPLPYFRSPDFIPHWLGDTISLDTFHRVAPFCLINQNEDTLCQEDLSQKVYVAAFFFVRCASICPQMTRNLKSLSDRFLPCDRVAFLSHSVMPWMDTPKELKLYAERFKAQHPNWHFLTGKQSDIYTLARKSYFAELEEGYDRVPEDFLHSEYFILVDQTGHIRGVYRGTIPAEMNKIEEDIKSLLAEEAFNGQ